MEGKREYSYGGKSSGFCKQMEVNEGKKHMIYERNCNEIIIVIKPLQNTSQVMSHY